MNLMTLPHLWVYYGTSTPVATDENGNILIAKEVPPNGIFAMTFTGPVNPEDEVTFFAYGICEGEPTLWVVLLDEIESLSAANLITLSEPPEDPMNDAGYGLGFGENVPIGNITLAISPSDTEVASITDPGVYVIGYSGDGPPPPAGACFWKDLRNVRQVCDGAPEPEPTGVIQFSSPQGDGGGDGAFRLLFLESGERSGHICSTALYNALLEAAANSYPVTITGALYIDEAPPVECGYPMFPDTIVWDETSFEMTLQEWGGGSFAQFYWSNGTDDMWTQSGGVIYWIRLDVNGVIYYGVLHMGDGI